MYYLSYKVRITEHVLHMFELCRHIWYTSYGIRHFHELTWSKRSWPQFGP